MITNVPGTAHPGVGAIDKINKFLSTTLRIPSFCWWRDDVNRRLDDAWSIKWEYPVIMTGPDFLRALVESGLSEHKERRSAAIRAFLRHQYETDEEVRFKQVELQNKLLDLFIDVPMGLRGGAADRKRARFFYSVARRASGHLVETDAESIPGLHHHEFPAIAHDSLGGAATLLLDSVLQSKMPHVVVEGAPGQGKSRLSSSGRAGGDALPAGCE